MTYSFILENKLSKHMLFKLDNIPLLQVESIFDSGFQIVSVRFPELINVSLHKIFLLILFNDYREKWYY